MSPARVHPAPPRRRATLTLAAAVLLCPLAARAQSGQEKIIQQRLERAGTLAYDPAEKSFSTGAAVGDRRASVRSFAFGTRTAYGKSGDGAFHARSFNDGRGSFRTDHYTVKRATAVDRQALPQADRTFATTAVPVRGDRLAGKTVESRADVSSTKPFLVPGKRQDTIDELRRQKDLTIDQVREILNKSR